MARITAERLVRHLQRLGRRVNAAAEFRADIVGNAVTVAGLMVDVCSIPLFEFCEFQH